MVDLRRTHYAKVVHPFLSVYLPFLFLYTAIVVLVGGAFTMYDVQVFPPFFFVILLLAGISETVTGNMLYKERVTGIVPRLREFVVVLAVSFGLILLFYGDLTSGDIDFRRFNIWLSLILVGAQWLFSYYVHSKLREREIFLSFFEGKEQRTFQDVYAAHNHEGGEAIKALQSLRKLTFGYLTVAFVLLLIMTWAVNVQLRGIESVLVFLLFTSFFVAVATFNRYIEMQQVMASGYAVDRKQDRQKFSTMLLVFAVVAVVALPVAGRQALLPTSYLESAIAWLADLGRRERGVEDVEPPSLSAEETMEELPDYLGPAQRLLGERGGGTNIGPIIGWILLGLLGIGFLYFLVAPLLRIQRRGGNVGEAIQAGLRRFVTNLQNGWKSFVAGLRRLLRQSRKVGEFFTKIREQAKAVAEAREEAAARRAGVSKRDRRIHNRVLKSFMRFTKWAKRHEVSFHPSIAPREFSEMVARKVPERQDDVIEIAQLFEEIVYSHHEIENSLQNRYHEKVSAVVKTR